MMRALSLIPIVILVALPALVLPTPGVAAIGALAGLLCAAGALGRLRALVTAGGSLALIQYALALWVADAPSNLLGAAALGVVLALVLDVADFLRRFPGATLTPPALRRQVRHWIASALLGALAATALAAVATLIGLGGPPALSPILAAAGALGAAAGVAGALRQRRAESG